MLLALRSPFDSSKRKGYLSWVDYFMALAFLSAKRSKDPNNTASLLLQFGVFEVIYFVEKRLANDTIYTASYKLLEMARIKVRKHQPEITQMLIKFEEP